MEIYVDYIFHCENQFTYFEAILLQKYYISSREEFCKKRLISSTFYFAM